MADIFPSERFEGSLSNGAASVPIAFVVSAGEDCRLVFDVEPGGRDLGRMGFGVGATPGLEMPEYALRGRSAAGNTITSDSVSIIAHGHSGQGHTIGIEAGEATLVVPLNVKPNAAVEAVAAAMAEQGLHTPSRVTVWRRLMALRQVRGHVSGAGDVIVVECRAQLPVLSDGEISMPSLLVAARTSDGLIVAATLLRDARQDVRRIGGAIRARRHADVVSIDRTYADGFGDPRESLLHLTPGVARRILARAIGKAFGRLRLRYNLSRTDPEKLLTTKDDRPLSPRDAKTVIEEAIGVHNAGRSGSAGFRLS